MSKTRTAEWAKNGTILDYPLFADDNQCEARMFNADKWNGEPFAYDEAVKAGAYKLVNRLDDVMDDFDNLSEANKAIGAVYSDLQGGLFLIREV